MELFIELYNELSKADIVVIGFVLIVLIVNGAFKGITNKLKIKKQGKSNVHEACPHYPDFASRMEKCLEKTNKIDHIKYKIVPSEQLREADIVIKEIIDILRDNFNTLIDKLKSPETDKIEARKAYKAMISNAVGKEAKDHLRNWILKNHFTEKTDIEFSDYIAEKVKLIYDIVQREVTDNYLHKTMLVDRKKLSESVILNCSEKINPKINHLFIYARSVADNKEHEVKELEKEF